MTTDIRLSLSTRTAWMDGAACGNADPEGFFLEHERDRVTLARAKSLCRGCPVRQECLQYALDEDIWHGIWGGLTERERHALGRRLAVVR